jgi:glycosyltransferase involved in cell wall biosynthesis
MKMKILFVTAHKYLPQMHGGLQSSTDQLCHGLLQRGHEVAVLAGLMPGGLFAAKARIKIKINEKVCRCKVSRETGSGYTVWYAWFPWDAVQHVIRKEQPDLIVILQYQSVRMATAARATGIPILMNLADVEFHQFGGAFEDLGDVPCVANSRFTAQKYQSAYRVNPVVIYPIIFPEKYKTISTRENVTFINPHPKKGRDIALQIARYCPEIPFAFVESWPLAPDEREELMKKLATVPNVTFQPALKNMREIYGKCRILLAPSIWEEAYGRVATEAQVSGIPVIGSTRGGLPEAIGPGGIVLDPSSPVVDWAAAVRKLWQDQGRYAELSAAALAHAQRRDLTFAYQLDTWERVLGEAASRPRLTA